MVISVTGDRFGVCENRDIKRDGIKKMTTVTLELTNGTKIVESSHPERGVWIVTGITEWETLEGDKYFAWNIKNHRNELRVTPSELRFYEIAS